MTDIRRGRGSHRAAYFCAIAALGLALSGCGGSGGSTAASTAAASSAPAQASTTPQSSTSAPPSSTASSGSGPAASPPATPSSSTLASPPPTATIGNVTINWTPPTENTDGTPLTNLAGYDIHYGTASGNYTHSVTVSNPGIATYVVSNLSPGTYYFSVAALNSNGTESPLSSEVSTTVN